MAILVDPGCVGAKLYPASCIALVTAKWRSRDSGMVSRSMLRRFCRAISTRGVSRLMGKTAVLCATALCRYGLSAGREACRPRAETG